MKKLAVLMFMFLPISAYAQTPADLISDPQTIKLWKACQEHRDKSHKLDVPRYPAEWDNCNIVDQKIEATRVQRQIAVDALKAKADQDALAKLKTLKPAK